MRDTSGILLDRTPESSDLPDEIRRAVESDGDSVVADLHIWQVGAGKFAGIVSIVAHHPKPVEAYREMFREHEELVHVTVEVRQCREGEKPSWRGRRRTRQGTPAGRFKLATMPPAHSATGRARSRNRS